MLAAAAAEAELRRSEQRHPTSSSTDTQSDLVLSELRDSEFGVLECIWDKKACLARIDSNSHKAAAEDDRKVRVDARYDFGLGISRCKTCASFPHLNRGCRACRVKLCRGCFRSHACAGFDNAQSVSN